MSLDRDLRKLRLEKYTPAAADEARSWIEGILGEKLASNDLLDSLKDGTALCKIANLAIGPPGIKFKKSAMPFVQMENISHFLRACQSPPLNLPDHDVFLTVDLFEKKDPAQVLQCLGAFSRAANAANPSAFPSVIGPVSRINVTGPQDAGPTSTRSRGISNASNASQGSRPGLIATKTGDSGSGRLSPAARSPTSDRGASSPTVSTWSQKRHEGVTSPAWNIAQYGYMGGASQGNLGVVYGGRRQITSAGPAVPSAREKERKKKEQEAEAERQKEQMEEAERRRKTESNGEEERARLEEEQKWSDETARLRAEEKRRAEEEKRRWAEEERQWKLTEEKRRREEEEAEERLAEERRRAKSQSEARLRSASPEQRLANPRSSGDYRERIKQLEKELELARQREREYEEERQRRSPSKGRHRSRSRPNKDRPERPPSRHDSWSRNDREVLQTHWDNYKVESPQRSNPALPPRPLPVPKGVPVNPSPLRPQRTGEARPLPVPGQSNGSSSFGPRTTTSPPSLPSRPLPTPSASSLTVPTARTSPPANRTDRFLATNRHAPAQQPGPEPTYARELGATAEQDAENRRRAQSQAATRAGGWASKSLLEREMENERRRQREWEEAQKETTTAVRSGDGVEGIGGGIGGRWDVGQWAGYTGGDSQNKGAQGIGAGRRQIVGPRPLPNPPF